MKNVKLSKEERELLESVDREEWKITLASRFCLVLASLVLPACMSTSGLRPSQPVTFKVSPGTEIVALGAIKINVPPIVNNVDFFPPSLLIKAPGRTVYIDPVFVNNPAPGDFILITHSHGDHFSLPDIKRIAKAGTVFLGPGDVCRGLQNKVPDLLVKDVAPGQTLDFGDVKIETVAAYNLKKGLVAHPKKAGYVSYVVMVDGIRIFLGGDTDYVPEMNTLQDITVALVPIEGGNLAMSTQEAAALVNRVKPQVAIPIHYALKGKGAEKFRALVAKDIRVVVLDGMAAE